MTDSTSSTSSSTSSTTNTNLNSVFQSAITNILAYEKKPLEAAQTKRDTLKSRMSAYSKMTDLLEALNDTVRALYTSSGFSSLSYSRTALVTPLISDKTVATVTAGSGAVAGKYSLNVTNLAVAEQHVSNVQSSATAALGNSGTIWLGGTGTAGTSISSDTDSVLTGVSLGTVDSDTSELGYGDYTVETQTVDGKKQFRLRDADGELVKIKDANGDLTTDWITYSAGTSYDTGRGLVLNLSGTTGEDATVSYAAKGVSVTVDSEDSLVNIADKINAATQPEGREISATVVGNQLVMTAANTGTNHKMELGVTYSENLAGLSFTDTGAGTQEAVNASFTVNGISFTKQSNTGLDDVIHGATINLADDAEGQSATITIKKDAEGVIDKVNKFITAFNEVVDYIKEATAITKDDVSETYTYSALSTDTIFTELRSTLYETILGQYANSGTLTMLSELGITIDDDLVLELSDSSKLEEALSADYDGVVSLLDKAMGSFDTTLSRFTGETGFLESATDSLDEEYLELSGRIADMQTRLIDRKAQLTDMYAQMQSDMLMLQYTYQSWQSIYSGTMSYLG